MLLGARETEPSFPGAHRLAPRRPSGWACSLFPKLLSPAPSRPAWPSRLPLIPKDGLLLPALSSLCPPPSLIFLHSWVALDSWLSPRRSAPHLVTQTLRVGTLSSFYSPGPVCTAGHTGYVLRGDLESKEREVVADPGTRGASGPELTKHRDVGNGVVPQVPLLTVYSGKVTRGLGGATTARNDWDGKLQRLGG